MSLRIPFKFAFAVLVDHGRLDSHRLRSVRIFFILVQLHRRVLGSVMVSTRKFKPKQDIEVEEPHGRAVSST